MHDAAFQWVAQHVPGGPLDVLDLGGRNINGTCRDLFIQANYTALDIRAGRGVDIVANAATWVPTKEYDVVICTEVFEHTKVWKEICVTAFAALKPGGIFVVTCAGPGRFQHSAIDGGDLRQGEHYANVSIYDLWDALCDIGFRGVIVDQLDTDTRAVARKAKA